MKKPTLKVSILGTLLMAFIAINAHATKHVITVADNTFTPQLITTVMVGDTIRWELATNANSHTTTSASVPSGAASWNSTLSASNKSFEYKVTVVGDYGYVCSFHIGLNMGGGFSASAPTGIQQSTLFNANLSIFPKPAKETLNINFSSTAVGKSLVKLYDIQGREVLNENADLIIGANTLQYSIGNLNNGIYFVEVYANKRKLGTQKIIKE